MLRGMSAGVIAASLSIGCATLPAGAPRDRSDVPDGATVRYRLSPRGPAVEGSALGWSRDSAAVVLHGGDTVVVPDSARLEVRIPQRKGHRIAGAITGWGFAVAVMLADCGGQRTCGEENPLPLLGAALGWVIGDRVKTDWWVHVLGKSPHASDRE